MALDIWVVSSGGMITMGLNAVATVMENGGWKSTIWVAEMLGIAFCVMTYLRTHNMTAMFGWGLTFVLVTALLLTPKVTVVVNDLTAPDTIGRVDNVPVGLAMPLYLATGVGYTLTTTYEDIFHFPDERSYTKTGMLFASKLLQDSFTIDSRNPVLAYNMGEYAKNCVVPDIMLNHKYSMQDVMESEDVQAQIFSNPSPLRAIYWRDATGTMFMVCRDAAPRLKNLLSAESNNTGSTFMAHAVRMLPGNNAPQTVYAEQLAGSYEYFLGSSKSAQSIMMQNIAVAGLRRGLNSYVKGMNDTASMVDIASEQSLMKLRLSHAVSYTIATEVLPQLHTVLLLFCICIFPVMVLALYVREIAWAVIKSYLNFMGSLMLWPVMFAIFNFAVNYSTQNSFHATGPTLSNMNRLMETSTTTAGIAGWLMLSIPFLAFRLFTGLGQGFASLSSSLGSALSSASAADSGAVASGNMSVGNVQLDNINGHKTDMNRAYREGNTSMQLGNSAMRTVTQDGQTVYDASGATSRLPVDLHLDRNLASAAQRSVRDSMAQTEMAAQGYNHSVQETGSQLKQFHEQFGNSDSKTLSASTGMSITDAERVNKMQNVAQDYATRNHISLNEAYSELEDKSRSASVNTGARTQAGIDSSKSLWGKAGEWVTGASVKGDVHGGTELTGRTGSTSQTSEGGQSGSDNSQTISARESQDFSQGMDVLRNYSTTYNGQHVDNNASGLMNQISSGITTSDSRYAQFTASQAHTHEMQKMASETETLSAGARDNYTQQFVEWAQRRAPGNAETILTNTSDEGVQKERDGLVQEFFAEKLQGRIDGNYERNAGSTGEGMSAPANIAGAQFGGAYNNANQSIEAGVARNNIRTDVINDVEQQQGVVKNKAIEANDAIGKAKGETDSGVASRMGEYTNSANDFSENKRAADKQQDDLLVNPLKNHTHKDYKGNGKE
ncbi:conjugal transfer mating pair stabilization protein TraG [Pantoea eucrina]|uniref:Conjugal transfer mating pair stabilization protein TraG n=1 Tax=Pantoea eucrina TaxID=472693 RepID=A0ABS1Z8B6_9GAMM|nr:conjugal transfer mating-pair stabilization protein TraG [Pantoea eucrina]MBM0748658.1 conjugal transfer mating pair stabilization protein TraG [Pantoea eucrina]MDU6441182.1 conjugal transfer mating-pair stabilization protein TraG [Pantoea sp.]